MEAMTIPEKAPDALTRAFADDPDKQQQWASFIEAIEAEPAKLAKVIDELSSYLMPHAEIARRCERSITILRGGRAPKKYGNVTY
jgi:hypothetical protein